MTGWTKALAGISATLLLAVTPPAVARQVDVVDKPQDNQSPGLDIVTVNAQNNDRAVEVTVTFSRVLRGDLIVSVLARGTDRSDGVRIVSERRPRTGDETYLLPIAFGRGGTLRCRGLTGVWNSDADTVVLRMPSRCLVRGNYGAVRFAVLTEQAGQGGGDVDWAPEDATGDIDSTEYVPRG
ncbi:MAG: hypothetical protein M3353_00860 [Actinomycetota bacterium]|nr:hypothetical protein [Actinomycetota bacterium]